MDRPVLVVTNCPQLECSGEALSLTYTSDGEITASLTWCEVGHVNVTRSVNGKTSTKQIYDFGVLENDNPATT